MSMAKVRSEFVNGDLVFYGVGNVEIARFAGTDLALKFGTGATATSRGIRSLTETWTRADFTDGGSTAGTRAMSGTIPVGAVLLGSKVIVNLGFTGDTSAALIIGDGSDTDRYNTSTIDVFTTAANGVQSGVPSGNKLITTANSPTLTITSAADFTNVSAGSITVSIYYIETA